MTYEERFIEHLVGLVRGGDRASLARLRRGTGRRPGESVDALREVIPHLPPDAWKRDGYFLVAGLFGLHPRHTDSQQNMGAVFRQFGEHESNEKRFRALLNSHEDELGGHLQRAMTLARAKEVPVNFKLLLEDVLHWTHVDRFVQLRWASSFWYAGSDKSEAQGTAADQA